jgi:hypothetical protein
LSEAVEAPKSLVETAADAFGGATSRDIAELTVAVEDVLAQVEDVVAREHDRAQRRKKGLS